MKCLYTFRYSKAMALPRRIREFLFLVWLIREQIKVPFDLVHAHSTFPTGFTAVILQKLFGVPAIVSLDGGEGVSFPDIDFGDANHVNRTAINKWVIRNARIVTALTRFHCELVKKNLSISRNIVVVMRGIDTEKFSFNPNRKIGCPLKILSVGYLSPIKDPETLIRTFFLIQQNIDSQLTHIGKDYMNGVVHRMAKDLGISDKVTFIEYVNNDQLGEYYRSADLFLHTARYESQGIVIAEAMASGALVCGTHVGLLADLSGECCLTVPPRDAEGLSTAAVTLLSSEEKMNRLRMNAFHWTKKNNLERSVKDLLTIYSQL